ncbi:MAG: twitch domain-containing radical SAM protein [Bacteroidetes bacterium]|nr:twitch domain-containing radical SAM protein [Bacteroidota bacterium]
MSPWIQLHAQTNGKVMPCCMSSISGGNEIGDLRQNPDLSAAWNSENMKQLRRNMLNGEKSSICGNCYKYEELDKFSERMQYNKDFRHYYHRVEQTKADGTLPDPTVPIIDIRFSNKCNYKCRICSSEYSTLWYEDEAKLGIAPVERAKEIKAASEISVFWESFKKLMPGVKRLHFAGGEPLFMEEHYDVLEHLISIGKTDITLTYNTNLSTLRFKRHNVVEYWKKFKQVDVWASLDGMDSQGDYQRKGQKWLQIEENIRAIQAQCPNLYFGVNITTSILNIFHIPDFYRHLVSKKLVDADRVNMYLLFYPGYFAVTNLTPALKEQVTKLYADFEHNYLNSLAGSEKIKSHIAAALNLMNSRQDHLLLQFTNAIRQVDRIREEDFLGIYPELKDMLAEEDTNA